MTLATTLTGQIKPAGCGSGKTSPRRALLAQITTLTADTPRGQHIRALLDELDDIDADREMADRFVEPGSWLSELRAEERDAWEHLHEALATREQRQQSLEV